MSRAKYPKPNCPECQSRNAKSKGSVKGTRYYTCLDCRTDFKRRPSGEVEFTGQTPKVRKRDIVRKLPKFKASFGDMVTLYQAEYHRFAADYGQVAANEYLAVMGGYGSLAEAQKNGWPQYLEGKPALEKTGATAS